ncbi:MAG: TIGR04255 family protein [Candidatus Methylacidiphilaceae bacterium]
MSPIPKRLQKEPLIEAVWQVLFEPEANKPLGEILPGLLYSAKSKESTDSNQVQLHRLPPAEIPRQVAMMDPNLRYAVKYRIESADSPFVMQVGERVVTLNCRRPYAGWQIFKEQISILAKTLEDSGLALNPQGHSLRYIDLVCLDSPPTLAPLKATLQIGDHAIMAQRLRLRVELPDNEHLHVLQVVCPGEVIQGEGTMRGLLIDLETVPTLKEKSWSSLLGGLDDLHDAVKNMFFEHVLSEEAIRRLNPEY